MTGTVTGLIALLDLWLVWWNSRVRSTKPMTNTGTTADSLSRRARELTSSTAAPRKVAKTLEKEPPWARSLMNWESIFVLPPRIYVTT